MIATDIEIVTVSVITYNSSKFVLETLESIKAQTYPNLILHICDDCSTDNTVELCREWIEKNKSRFESTDIIVPDHNTGVSANCNRAWDACTTKYMKSIAGDDILLPNCIEDNMAYVRERPDVGFVFSRATAFGSKRFASDALDKVFYDFFSHDRDGQYSLVYDKGVCPPAPSNFVNLEVVRKFGLRHDERIPLLEDLPKWVNALKLGVMFGSFDKPTVLYRVHESSLSTTEIPSPLYEKSRNLYWLYYHFVPEYAIDPERAIKVASERMMDYYGMYVNEVKTIRLSRRFRTLSQMLRPVDLLLKRMKPLLRVSH